MHGTQVVGVLGAAAALLTGAILVAVFASDYGMPGVRGPILIVGDDDLTPRNGVRSGNGTEGNPFVIEEWTIAAEDGPHAVNIRETAAHLVVRNLTVECDVSTWVLLWRVQNVRVEGLRWSGCQPALSVVQSRAVLLRGNDLSAVQGNNFGGVSVTECDRIWIERNRIPAPAPLGPFPDPTTVFGSGINIFRSTNVTVIGNEVAAQQALIMVRVADGVVTDNVIAATGRAIGLHAASNVTVEGNRLSLPGLQSGQRAFWVTGSREIRILGNEISSAHGKGLQLESTVGAMVVGNVFLNTGITIRGTLREHFASHAIDGNRVNGLPISYVRGCADFTADGISLGQLIVVDCARVRISDLEFTNTDDAVQVAWSRDVVVAGVRVRATHGYGVFLAFVENGAVEENALTQNDLGYRSRPAWSDPSAVEGSAISGSDGGIFVQSSANVQIARNEISDMHWSYSGVEDRDSTELVVDANRFVNTAYAIVLRGSSKARVTGNEVSYAYMGIYLGAVDGVRLERNGLASSLVGIALDGQGEEPPSGAVTVVDNEFIRNGDQADERARTVHGWDGGYPQGGNYWSDYTGEDRCHGVLQDNCTTPDGFGDTPYIIDGENRDRYPRMIAPARFNFPPVARFTISPYTAPVSARFTVDASPSSDVESPSSALEVRWDWEADGVWDTEWSMGKVADHAYDSVGWHVIRLEVRDPGGRTATTVRWAFVSSPP